MVREWEEGKKGLIGRIKTYQNKNNGLSQVISEGEAETKRERNREMVERQGR